MTIPPNMPQYSPHFLARRVQRNVSLDAAQYAVQTGKPVHQGNGRLRWTGDDGVVVITDPTGSVYVTTLGKVAPAPHDRPGAGLSRHRKNRRGPNTPKSPRRA